VAAPVLQQVSDRAAETRSTEGGAGRGELPRLDGIRAERADCVFDRAALSRRLEQLDGISVWILDLDLPAARPGLHVVAKMEARLFQRLGEPGQIPDPKHDTIPSAGFLLLSVRHRPRSGRLGAAEQNLGIAERDTGERGKLLVFEREAQVCGVERDGAGHIFDLISDAVHALHELVLSGVSFLSCFPCFTIWRHLWFSFSRPLVKERAGAKYHYLIRRLK
jgi:hypothetical protein